MILTLACKIASVVSDECACAKDNVNIRTGPGLDQATVGRATSGQCFRFIGHIQSNDQHHWANVQYNGQVHVVLDCTVFLLCSYN